MKNFKISEKDINNLSKKLQKLAKDLPENEEALLNAMISFSKDGFANATDTFEKKLAGEDISKAGFDLTISDNLDISENIKEVFKNPSKIPDGGDVSDSIGVGVICVSWSKDYNSLADFERTDILKDHRIRKILNDIRDLKGLQ